MKEEDEIKRKRVKLRCNFVVIYWRFKPYVWKPQGIGGSSRPKVLDELAFKIYY
jgi:hypothetical protein